MCFFFFHKFGYWELFQRIGNLNHFWTYWFERRCKRCALRQEKKQHFLDVNQELMGR